MGQARVAPRPQSLRPLPSGTLATTGAVAGSPSSRPLRTTMDVEGHDKSARDGLLLIRSVLQGHLTFHSSTILGRAVN